PGLPGPGDGTGARSPPGPADGTGDRSPPGPADGTGDRPSPGPADGTGSRPSPGPADGTGSRPSPRPTGAAGRISARSSPRPGRSMNWPLAAGPRTWASTSYTADFRPAAQPRRTGWPAPAST